MVTESQIWQALQTVSDPEYPLSIVDLGMVYAVKVDGDAVNIEITFTAIGCPAIDMILSDVRDAINKVPDVGEVSIDVVWSPPWNKNRITERGRAVLQTYGVGV